MNPMPRVQKARIQPLNCYLQGKDFLGHEYWTFWGICFLGLFIGGLVPLILVGACWCGILKCFLNRSYNRPVSLNTLFEGFEHFGDGLIAALCWFGCLLPVTVIFLVTFFGGIATISIGEPVAGILGALLIAAGYLILFMASFLYGIGIVFSAGLIVEHRLTGMDAFKVSFKGVMANFWGLLAAALVGGILQSAAFMMCIVPGVLIIPMIAAGHYLCYRKIFVGSAPSGQPVAPVKSSDGVVRVYGTLKP